ncbi:MAG: HAD hydrolase-like protein, partial [Bacillota bacterium]|nr:HAD hydrolase-like protein [Bacillota bacterium]
GNIYESMLTKGPTTAQIEHIISSYNEKQEQNINQFRLFPGIAEALAEIAESNKIFIITSNVASIVKAVLDRHGITCVEDILGAERDKSKANKITAIRSKYPQLPAFYVGDTEGDIIEGKLAGSKTLGVAWGWHGAERLSKTMPDHIVNSPEELAVLISSAPVVSLNCLSN